MSIIRPFTIAATTALMVFGLSISALLIGLALAVATPSTASDVKLSAGLGQSVIPTGGGKVYLRIGLRAAALPGPSEESRAPINVALVLDRSGSMRGKRIAAAKEASRLALGRLGRDDTVALVAYNHNVDVLKSAERLSSHDSFLKAIDRLKADGRTALFAGVEAGGREVARHLSERRINRVILMSDGLANVGPSSPRELAQLGQQLGSKGMSVTTIGLGLGYNEDLMQRLAQSSDGNHAFAETPDDLIRIFNAEFGDALSIAAQDIEIIIEVRAGFRPVRVLGRDSKIEGDRISLRMNQLTALAERYIIVELDAAGSAPASDVSVATAEVSYHDLRADLRRTETLAVSGRVSDDRKQQTASRDGEIMSEVTVQIATERSEEAVSLRDKGDLDGARKLLRENAAYLDETAKDLATAAAPPSAKVMKELRQLQESNVSASSNLSEENWAKTRKAMRYEQHKAKKRQSY